MTSRTRGEYICVVWSHEVCGNWLQPSQETNAVPLGVRGRRGGEREIQGDTQGSRSALANGLGTSRQSPPELPVTGLRWPGLHAPAAVEPKCVCRGQANWNIRVDLVSVLPEHSRYLVFVRRCAIKLKLPVVLTIFCQSLAASFLYAAYCFWPLNFGFHFVTGFSCKSIHAF